VLDVATAVIRRGPSRSDVIRSRAAGPLRLLHPRAAGNAAWVVTSSFGGGLVDGDEVALDVVIESGTALITTQASSKIYKGTSRQQLALRVHGDGCALVVPDPIVPYRDASFTQVSRIALDAESSLVLSDVVTAGRIAHGERWACTRFDARLDIRIGARLVLCDRVVLDGDIARRMTRFTALGTAVLLGPRVGASGAHGSRRWAASTSARSSWWREARWSMRRGDPEGRGRGHRTGGRDRARPASSCACAELGEDPWSRKW
jgi:urease accessory protein